MKNPFSSLAAKIYRRWKPIFCNKQNHSVEKELQQLHPFKNSGKLYDDYQIKKISVVTVILIIGIISAVCLHLSSRLERKSVEGVQIKRNEWGKGNYEITLLAETEEWSRKLSFLVEERKLSEEEKKTLLKKLQMELPNIIKKNNWDLEHIISDLYLPSLVPGYPFQIRWESSDNDRISYKGEVNRSDLMRGEEKIRLTATVMYEKEKFLFTYDVILLSETVNEEDNFFMLLENELQETNKKENTNKIIILPENFYGRAIEWKEVKSDKSVFFIWISILASVMVCKAMDNNIKKRCGRRKNQLLADYSGFVNRFRLYLSAGLTVKNTFIKITNDYEGKRNPKKKYYLYEEMKIACYQLENGVMEERVYQEFGRRCEEVRYRRFAFLLSVHLKQGNSQLLQLLEKEADSALEDRRHLAKKAGEEAGTKLLFPMMLMLLVAMFLILLPAYYNFGNN